MTLKKAYDATGHAMVELDAQQGRLDLPLAARVLLGQARRALAEASEKIGYVAQDAGEMGGG